MSDLALDYVSPLPPVRSGIADYSADLLPHLEPLCDLRVVRLPGQPVSEAIAERWRPVTAEALGQGGRTPLFHMGNNRYHLEVERLAMRTPGVLVLHDFVLHHFLIGRTVGRGDLDGYRRRLAMDHGWQGESMARAIRWGAFSDSLQFGLPAHRRLVSRQRGIVVHSDWAREMLTEENPDLAVRTVPMAIPLPPRVDRERGEAFRQRHGIPLGAPLLGTFGFQTPMKRPEIAVRAMATEELAGAHLVIAGELAEIVDLTDEIASAGLGSRVHVTGFLDYEDFEAAIAACDLALNLRYPSAGETSAALLRVLAMGRPTLVSEYAQFAELPSEVAIKVPVGEGEVEAVAKRCAELLARPDRLRSMGETAREIVRSRHDPAAAARAMVQACEELSRIEPPYGRRTAVPPPSSLTWRRIDGDLEVHGHEAPWEEGERRRLAIDLTNRGPARWLASGPGGVSLDIELLDAVGHRLDGVSSVGLPGEVASGESVALTVDVRRPPGSTLLRIESRVGDGSMKRIGGMRWESAI